MGTGLAIEPRGERHYGRWLLGFFVVILLTVAGWYAYQWYSTGMRPPVPIPVAKADPSLDESDVTDAMLNSYKVGPTEPRYISIPSISLDKARVFSVGVTSQNLLDMPHNIHDAGWYKKSVTPGNGYGAVLIDGNSLGATKNGAFAKLNNLQPGDEITVERGDGKTLHYSVVENQIMTLDEVNATGMQMMMQSVDSTKEGLNLMTNAGTWIPRTGLFDKRVMLRAAISE
jgi:sortase (surface protein transpeptidase)